MSATSVTPIGGPGYPAPRLFSAAADPVVGNDLSVGHQVGDVVINTASGAAFTCVGNTLNAAVWTAMTLTQESVSWNPSSVSGPFAVMPRAGLVIGIVPNVEIAGTDAGSVTAVIKKAATGTALSAGTALHTGTINLKGTAATNQALTLAASASLALNAGDRIGISFTGTMTAAIGSVTVLILQK